MSKHESFSFDLDNHTTEDRCWRYCRIHWYWEFDLETHLRFPTTYNYLSSRYGWVNQVVACGPGGWFPKKPTPDHLTDMTSRIPR